MHAHLANAAPGGHFDQRDGVIFVAVHATRRRQAHEVHGVAAVGGLLERGAEHRVVVELTGLHGIRDAREVLVDDPAGA